VNRVIRRTSAIGLLDGNAILFVNKIFFSHRRGRRGRREKREERVRFKRGRKVNILGLNADF
jgi:hypothetical protein